MKLQVFTSQEINELTQDIIADARQSPIHQSKLGQLVEEIEAFQSQWDKTFCQFGDGLQGELAYRNLIIGFREHITPMVNGCLPADSKGKSAVTAIGTMLSSPQQQRPIFGQLKTSLWAKRKQNQPSIIEKAVPTPLFDRPVFIVSAPRAGSTLLFETLSQFSDFWTMGTESHETIEGIPDLHPSAHNFQSNRLTEIDAVPHVGAELCQRFTQALRDRNGRLYRSIPEEQRSPSIRFLEKTPKNSLRIPFLKAIFPDALFIYLYREPKANISSMIEGWRSRRFVSYRNLPDWAFREWSFLLVPGWSSFQDCSIADIAARQWRAANAYILEDLQALPTTTWCLVKYDDLVRHPKPVIQSIHKFAGLNWDQHIENLVSQSLPVSSMSLSTPSSDKWKKNEKEIISVLPTLESIIHSVEEIRC